MSATQTGYDGRIGRKLRVMRQSAASTNECEDEEEVDALQAVKDALGKWKTRR